MAGAAYATVAGQVLAAVIVSSGFRRPPAPKLFLAYAARIYQLGYPSIFMQMLFTVYIMALNLILAGFSDAAVTVLGLYYKVQSFFFIPPQRPSDLHRPPAELHLRQGDLLPLPAGGKGLHCAGHGVHAGGDRPAFELIPAQLPGAVHLRAGGLCHRDPRLPHHRPELSARGALPDLPGVLPGHRGALPSILLSLTRQIFCLIPVFWFFSRIDLSYAWFAFPIAEVITGTLGLIFYARRVHIWGRLEQAAQTARRKGAVVMKMITAIINKRDSGEVCAALTEAGYYFTRMSSTGGFLTGGNTTLLIGTPEERVPQAISIIREHCSRRTEKISSNVQLATPSAPYPTEVTVGGATLFVSDVTQFEKI
mgnify:CR=1 FL=1